MRSSPAFEPLGMLFERRAANFVREVRQCRRARHIRQPHAWLQRRCHSDQLLPARPTPPRLNLIVYALPPNSD